MNTITDEGRLTPRRAALVLAVLLALGLGCVVYLLYHFWGGGQE